MSDATNGRARHPSARRAPPLTIQLELESSDADVLAVALERFTDWGAEPQAVERARAIAAYVRLEQQKARGSRRSRT